MSKLSDNCLIVRFATILCQYSIWSPNVFNDWVLILGVVKTSFDHFKETNRVDKQASVNPIYICIWNSSISKCNSIKSVPCYRIFVTREKNYIWDIEVTSIFQGFVNPSLNNFWVQCLWNWCQFLSLIQRLVERFDNSILLFELSLCFEKHVLIFISWGRWWKLFISFKRRKTDLCLIRAAIIESLCIKWPLMHFFD